MWGKRNKQPYNERDRNDDAIIQTITTERENTINLFTQFGINEPTSGGESNSPFHYDQWETLHKEFPIGLQELILILPKSRISSRGQETQFDLVYPRCITNPLHVCSLCSPNFSMNKQPLFIEKYVPIILKQIF